jgi:hypothetical protein
MHTEFWWWNIFKIVHFEYQFEDITKLDYRVVRENEFDGNSLGSRPKEGSGVINAEISRSATTTLVTCVQQQKLFKKIFSRK